MENALAMARISVDGVVTRLLNEGRRMNVRENMLGNNTGDYVLVTAAKRG